MAQDEKLVHIHSSFKSNGTNTDFQINYNNAIHMQNTIYVRVKSVTIPNMFDNIYGMASKLVFKVNGLYTVATIPNGGYSALELASAITTVLSTIPSLSSVTVTYVDSRFNFDFGLAGIELVGTNEANSLLSTIRSMNEIIGCGVDTVLTGIIPVNLPHPPALFGPMKIFIVCDRLGFGTSVHANGFVHSKIASISLANVPYGNIAHHVVPDRANSQIYFRDHREVNILDISLVDEIDQPVILPPNAHVDIELIIGSTN